MTVNQSGESPEAPEPPPAAAVESEGNKAEALYQGGSSEPWPPLYVNLLQAILMLAELDPENAVTTAPPNEARIRLCPPVKRASRVVANALLRGDLVARTTSGEGRVIWVHPDAWLWIRNEVYWDAQLKDLYSLSWICEAEARVQSLQRLWVRSCDVLPLQSFFAGPLSHIRAGATPSVARFLKADTDLSYLMLQDIGKARGRALSRKEEWAWAKALGVIKRRLEELRRKHRHAEQKRAGRPRKEFAQN